MRIGLFGGTFDPIHFGHINLALELKEKCQLDEVWFIPAGCSPFRTKSETSAMHRKNMVELAISSILGFKTIDIELEKCPSYTIDSINVLLSQYPEHVFFLLLSEDSALGFPKWKNAEEIVKKITLIVGKRKGHVLSHFSEEALIEQALLKGLVNTTEMEIEATSIRKRLEKKLYCGHLVPPKVLDYIYQNQLYYIS